MKATAVLEKTRKAGTSEATARVMSPTVPNGPAWVALAGAVAAIGWAYADALQQLIRIWSTEADYNHGFLVPLFSLALLWFRRSMMTIATMRGSWWGVVPLLLAIGMRWIASYWFYPTLSGPSLIPCLLGVVMLAGGWQALRWAWPSILFLGFMFPLPAFLAGWLSHPLQRIATICSTWLLQLCGIPAIASGNVIQLTNGTIGVVEACSGLRMLMLFLAITVGASFLIRRPLWEKVLVAVSALAIGIVTNIIRITATSIVHERFDPKLANVIFHDVAGWLMMPVATVLLWIELWLLSQLLMTPVDKAPVLFDHKKDR